MLRRPLFALGACALTAGGYLYNSDDRTRFSFVRRAFAAESVPFIGSQTLPKSDPAAKWDANWDSRNPKSMIKPSKLKQADEKTKQELIDKATPKATRHIILIRHGQYNLDGDDDEAHTLTKLGRAQATCTGVRLRDSGTQFDLLVTSSMTRAQETAKLIAQSLPNSLRKVSDPMLEEGAPYPPEPPLGHWKPEPKEFLTDGTRIEAAFRKYFHRAEPEQEKDSYQLLVCHGNVIRYFVCRALQFPPEGWLRLSLAHCSLTWLMIRPSGRVIVKSFGDFGHLPPNKVTFA